MRLSVHGAAGMLAPPCPVGRKEENAGREVMLNEPPFEQAS